MRLFEIAQPEPGQKIGIETGLEFYANELADLKKELQKASMVNRPYDELIQSRKEISDKISEVMQSIKSIQQTYHRMPAVQKIWNEIQTSCSDAINDMKQAGKLLYRGLKTETRPAFHDRSKTRRPRDSDPFISQVFDYCLVQLGAKALRSNSTFTTSDKFQSEGYGNLYMIFPVNGQYTFTWTNTKDLIIDRDDIDIFINRQKIHELNDEINYIVIEESKMLRNDPRHDMDIIQALSPLKNISLGELFYTLCDPESSIHTVDLKKYNLNLHWEYYVDVDSMKNRYEPRFSDLAAAIESGNEVCISGQYIALSTLFFESFVIKSLGMSPPKPTSPY